MTDERYTPPACSECSAHSDGYGDITHEATCPTHGASPVPPTSAPRRSPEDAELERIREELEWDIAEARQRVAADQWTIIRRALDSAMRYADLPYEKMSAELDGLAAHVGKQLRASEAQRVPESSPAPSPAFESLVDALRGKARAFGYWRDTDDPVKKRQFPIAIKEEAEARAALLSAWRRLEEDRDEWKLMAGAPVTEARSTPAGRAVPSDAAQIERLLDEYVSAWKDWWESPLNETAPAMKARDEARNTLLRALASRSPVPPETTPERAIGAPKRGNAFDAGTMEERVESLRESVSRAGDAPTAEEAEKLKDRLHRVLEAWRVADGELHEEEVLDQLVVACEPLINRLSHSLLYYFGTTDPQLLAEVWSDQAIARDELRASRREMAMAIRRAARLGGPAAGDAPTDEEVERVTADLIGSISIHDKPLVRRVLTKFLAERSAGPSGAAPDVPNEFEYGPRGDDCEKCGAPLEYTEQPTIHAGIIGACAVWVCINEDCPGNATSTPAGRAASSAPKTLDGFLKACADDVVNGGSE